MSDNFTITRTEKETETKKTVTIDIKRISDKTNTISGDIESVVKELKCKEQD